MQNWPINAKPLAWSPGSPEVGVPLRLREKSLTWQAYLDRLRSRVQWIAENTDDPEEVYDRVWWDCMGSDPQMGPMSHLDSLEFLDVLSLRGARPDKFPAQVENQPEVVENILELWNLEDWLMNLLPLSRE